MFLNDIFTPIALPSRKYIQYDQKSNKTQARVKTDPKLSMPQQTDQSLKSVDATKYFKPRDIVIKKSQLLQKALTHQKSMTKKHQIVSSLDEIQPFTPEQQQFTPQINYTRRNTTNLKFHQQRRSQEVTNFSITKQSQQGRSMPYLPLINNINIIENSYNQQEEGIESIAEQQKPQIYPNLQSSQEQEPNQLRLSQETTKQKDILQLKQLNSSHRSQLQLQQGSNQMTPQPDTKKLVRNDKQVEQLQFPTIQFTDQSFTISVNLEHDEHDEPRTESQLLFNNFRTIGQNKPLILQPPPQSNFKVPRIVLLNTMNSSSDHQSPTSQQKNASFQTSQVSNNSSFVELPSSSNNTITQQDQPRQSDSDQNVLAFFYSEQNIAIDSRVSEQRKKKFSSKIIEFDNEDSPLQNKHISKNLQRQFTTNNVQIPALYQLSPNGQQQKRNTQPPQGIMQQIKTQNHHSTQGIMQQLKSQDNHSKKPSNVSSTQNVNRQSYPKTSSKLSAQNNQSVQNIQSVQNSQSRKQSVQSKGRNQKSLKRQSVKIFQITDAKLKKAIKKKQQMTLVQIQKEKVTNPVLNKASQRSERYLLMDLSMQQLFNSQKQCCQVNERQAFLKEQKSALQSDIDIHLEPYCYEVLDKHILTKLHHHHHTEYLLQCLLRFSDQIGIQKQPLINEQEEELSSRQIQIEQIKRQRLFRQQTRDHSRMQKAIQQSSDLISKEIPRFEHCQTYEAQQKLIKPQKENSIKPQGRRKQIKFKQLTQEQKNHLRSTLDEIQELAKFRYQLIN